MAMQFPNERKSTSEDRHKSESGPNVFLLAYRSAICGSRSLGNDVHAFTAPSQVWPRNGVTSLAAKGVTSPALKRVTSPALKGHLQSPALKPKRQVLP